MFKYISLFCSNDKNSEIPYINKLNLLRNKLNYIGKSFDERPLEIDFY